MSKVLTKGSSSHTVPKGSCQMRLQAKNIVNHPLDWSSEASSLFFIHVWHQSAPTLTYCVEGHAIIKRADDYKKHVMSECCSE